MTIKRLAYLLTGAVVFVLVELGLEAIQFMNPPQWFYPIWIFFSPVFGIVALPAHLIASFISSLLPLSLQPPPLPKPTLIELGSLYIGILLLADAVEGALIAWLICWKKKIR